MLQKINLVLMIIVMLFVAGMCIVLGTAHRDMEIAIDALTTQVDDLRAEVEGRGVPAGEARRGAPANASGQISISGAVQRPGIYALPSAGGLSVPRAITAAGGSANPQSTSVMLIRANGARSTRLLSEYLADPEPTLLEAGDTLYLSPAGGDDDDGLPEADGSMPPILTEAEIDQYSASELQYALLKVVHARNNRSRYTPAQVEQIDRQYELLMAALRNQRGATRSSEPSARPATIFVSGPVGRPGVYQLPSSGTMTLTQLLTMAGTDELPPEAVIRVVREVNGAGESAARCRWSDLASGQVSFRLQAGDRVDVDSEAPLNDADRDGDD